MPQDARAGDAPPASLMRDYAEAVAHRPILTPDRRLRVFVSSTLRELALERAEAREAIASLRLAPILFEQGERPHAPRDLYSAYVGQSDVFVGIYWQSYGWVGPGAEISGLEGRVRTRAGQAHASLRQGAGPGPRGGPECAPPSHHGGCGRFSTADELGVLLTDDLAHLLTERFDAHTIGPEERSGLPARTTSFVGRGRELEEIVPLLERTDVRLMTLIGPGGIGKSRLAVEVARRLAANYADGVVYVALDRLTDPELVPAAIADALGLPPPGPDQESGPGRLLRGRQLLLVLDNSSTCWTPHLSSPNYSRRMLT
jgi:hypothetical protein